MKREISALSGLLALTVLLSACVREPMLPTEPTTEPTAAPTAKPTEAPTPTPEPTIAPSATPVPTEAPVVDEPDELGFFARMWQSIKDFWNNLWN